MWNMHEFVMDAAEPFRLAPVFARLGEFFASRTVGTRRGGGETAPRTTARGGGTKSAKPGARLHAKMAAGAGEGNQSPSEKRTVGKHASAARTKRGRGDAGKAFGSRDRQGRQGAPKRAK